MQSHIGCNSVPHPRITESLDVQNNNEQGKVLRDESEAVGCEGP